MSSAWPVRPAMALAMATASKRPKTAIAKALPANRRTWSQCSSGGSKLGKAGGIEPTIFTPCSSQYGIRSSTRAIVPSSFITSQTTPAGISPASRARSTAASVCPPRCRTPPSRARSGNTWPGRTRSPGPFVRSIATWIVRERSCAEIPVAIPSRASTDTVKAVPNGVSLRSVIWPSASSSQRSSVRQRQIRPRPCVAMKLIASGVANWAAIVRSPSFSRSAASTTTTNLPSRMSSIASSIVANGARFSVAAVIEMIVPPGQSSGSKTTSATSIRIVRPRASAASTQTVSLSRA